MSIDFLFGNLLFAFAQSVGLAIAVGLIVWFFGGSKKVGAVVGLVIVVVWTGAAFLGGTAAPRLVIEQSTRPSVTAPQTFEKYEDPIRSDEQRQRDLRNEFDLEKDR